MELITVIGVIASICTGTSMLPQLVKLIREKKAEDISFLMLGVLAVGLTLWVVYGFMKDDFIIVTSNGVSLLTTLSVLTLGIIYSGKTK